MALPPAARRDTLVAGLALTLCLVLFPRALLRGELFFERDLHVDWYPRIAAISRSLASGSWPLWDPSIGFGQPLLADPGAQVMYPGTWLAIVLPVGASYTAFVLGHLLLTAVGTARLARVLGAGRVGAPAAALLWVASGPLQSSVEPLAPLRGCRLDALGPPGHRPPREEAGPHHGHVSRGGLRSPGPGGIGGRLRDDARPGVRVGPLPARGKECWPPARGAHPRGTRRRVRARRAG